MVGARATSKLERHCTLKEEVLALKKIDFAVTGPEPTKLLLEFANGEVRSVVFGSARFEPGQRLPEAGVGSHTGDEISYIISGRLTGESGGEPFEISAGEMSVIPAGEEHWAQAGPEPVELIYVLVERAS